MNRNPGNVIKGVAALVVLVILIVVVWNWYGDYRDAQQVTPGETTGTATATVPPAGKGTSVAPASNKAVPGVSTVVVLIDGLNFRAEPAADAKALRGLDKGEKLKLLATKETWYQVQASNGKVGWISSNPNYSRIEGQ